MKILPINNIKTQNTQFKAKFSKQDINHFVKELEGCDTDTVPKLYTMLEFVKNLPGEKAEILESNYRPWYQILIDDKSAAQGRYYINAYHALEDITIQKKGSPKKVLSFDKMTKDAFFDNFYKNSKKTINDIKKMFE